MGNPTDKEQTTPTADGGKQTPLDPSERKTGQGTGQDTRSGAEADAPGSKNAGTPGDPNQGFEWR